MNATPTLTRRQVLRTAGLGIGVAATGLGLNGCSLLPNATSGAALLTSAVPLPAPYGVPLPIPPRAQPSGQDAGIDVYDLTARPAVAEILPGVTTPVWGYDGSFPGPTIVAERDRTVLLRLHTELPVPTVLHLHGGATPAESDGFPTDLLVPEHWTGQHTHPAGDVAVGTREYRYPNRQPAASLWYHDHRMDFTGPQVWRGLFGSYLVHDPAEDALGLPAGEQDVPLLVCDRAFGADGSLAYPSLDRTLSSVAGVEEPYAGGVLGDVVLVNGAPWPELEVTARRYRFRILNASNARRFRFELDPPVAPIVQIGSDCGLLAEPVAHASLPVSPAERYDVVVDFGGLAAGTTVELRNGLGSGPTAQVMRFRVTGPAADDSRVPATLADVEPLDPARAATARRLAFARTDGRWTINGAPFDPNRPDATPRLRQLETWTITSDGDHPVHVHSAPFQVVDRAGGLADTDRGWKDTVAVGPAQTVTIATRFPEYRGRFVAHCHNLEHEDMMMMATIEVL
ncbi:multicopper oxidase family protein [Actinomycetes bacterium KLBMP 9759]